MKKWIVVLAVIAGITGIIYLGTKTNSETFVFPSKPIVALLPQLVPICACESTGHPDGLPRQYDNNGNVLLGWQDPLDIGMCQINLKWHGAEAKALGLNLFDEQDNIIFANWLYEKEGSKPWNWSKPCWVNYPLFASGQIAMDKVK